MNANKAWLCIMMALLFHSCGYSKSELFQKGRVWNYRAVFMDQEGKPVDTVLIRMRMEGNWIAKLSGQIPIVYTYSAGNQRFREPTGAIDNTGEVSIHAPRLGPFAFTEVLPMPTVSKPYGSTYESTIETKVVKSTMQVLNGKTIQQSASSVGEDSLLVAGDWVPCYKIQARNVNLQELVGQYAAQYWFNEDLGFVRLEYTQPSGAILDIRLVSVLDKGKSSND